MLGERIKQLRKEAGLAQRELGERLGVSTSAIGMYEQNRRNPDNETLLKLCDMFHVSADWLLGVGGGQLPREVDEETLELSSFFLDIKRQLLNQQGLMFNGEPMSDEDVEKVFDAMRIGAEIAIDKKRKKR